MMELTSQEEQILHEIRVSGRPLCVPQRGEARASSPPSEPASEAPTLPEMPEPATAVMRTPALDATQRLVNAFVTLPYHVVVGIAADLGLLQDNDEDVDSTEQYRRYFQRARDRSGGLATLWAEVAKHSDSIRDQPNPFQ
jgi:hypothetical protein